MRMKCDECGMGTYERAVLPEFDAGHCVGLGRLIVRDFPALVCTHCGSVATEGVVTSRVATAVAAEMLRHSTLTPEEARFLRRQTRDTQEEFARRFGVARATVNRWETGAVVLDGGPSHMVRTHVFLWLYEREPLTRDLLESLKGYFTDTEVETKKRLAAGAVLEGRALMAGL